MAPRASLPNESVDKHTISSKEKIKLCQNDVVIDRKIYKNRFYYKIKMKDTDEISWIAEDNIECDKTKLKNFASTNPTEDEDEWEVEEILDSRVYKGDHQYLIKWRNWSGNPTWEKADSCNCTNLIAAFENPKLKKLWNFQGSNQNLWAHQEQLVTYMRKYAKVKGYKVNIMEFKRDLPKVERPHLLKDGLNIGPLCYENHWYLIVILVGHICVTKRILIGDSLNTLIGVKFRHHPVVKRLSKLYPSHQIRPLRMTQMDRSDMCAYYVLAAFERALFLYNKKAQFVVESIFFDITRPEVIRARLRPDTDGDISVTLPIPEAYDLGPTCEFCEKMYDTRSLVNQHILRRHMSARTSDSS